MSARRERHRRRPMAVRGLVAVAGALASVAGLAFVWWLPELGVPLLAGGLGLLGLEFQWAARAQGWIEWQATRFRRWLASIPTALKALIVVATILVIAAAVWLALQLPL